MTGWAVAPGPLVLGAGQVHVWRLEVAQPAAEVARLGRLLAPEERARAAKFHFERDRRTFTVVRGALRALVGRYLEHAPEGLAFGYGAKGKPHLVTPAAPLRFNVSHSGDLALLAFSADRDVGVDVEQRRSLADLLSLAKTAFSAAEFAVMCGLPKALHVEAFFACWSRKEAFIKATGEGVSQLEEFDVSLVPGEPARLVAVRGAAAAHAWAMHELPALDGHAAALVVAGAPAEIACWSWTPDAG